VSVCLSVSLSLSLCMCDISVVSRLSTAFSTIQPAVCSKPTNNRQACPAQPSSSYQCSGDDVLFASLTPGRQTPHTTPHSPPTTPPLLTNHTRTCTTHTARRDHTQRCSQRLFYLSETEQQQQQQRQAPTYSAYLSTRDSTARHPAPHL